MNRRGVLALAYRGGWAVAAILPLCVAAQVPPATTPAYQDKVLDDGPQADLTFESELHSYSRQGWPRGARVDYSLAHDRSGSTATTQGLAAYLFVDTPDYGTLSLDAAVTTVRDDNRHLDQGRQQANRWRVDQRAMPLAGGWMANHAAGDISTVQVPQSLASTRIYLPSSPMEGASLQWQRGLDTQFNLSGGRFGLFSGQSTSGFDTVRGTVASAGVQQKVGSGMQAAAQFVQANDVPDSGFGLTGRTTRSLWTSFSQEGLAPWSNALAAGSRPIAERTGGLRWQANVLRSESRDEATGQEKTAGGYWVDSRWRTGQTQHEAGLFRFDPGLRWGPYVPAADLQGVYWRGDLSSRQWQLNGSVEYADSLSGLDKSSSFASVAARYRIDTRNTVGAQIALREGGGSGRSLLLSWDHLGSWGQTQWRLEAAQIGSRRVDRFAADQQWLLRGPRTLATSLSWERERDAGNSRTLYGWGLLGSQNLGSNFSLDASLRGHTGAENQLNANLGAVWQVSPGWTLLAQYSASRGQDRQGPLLTSALTDAATPVEFPVQSARRLAVTLRYEERAGSARSVIGGSPGSGAGRVEGAVFFDADANGRREASESGVPGVVVLLDRRYTARTDAQGRYEFAAVVPGEHTIEVIADNVPLPWSPALRESSRIQVELREKTVFDMPVQRER